MGGGMLSQDEIDNLLNAAEEDTSGANEITLDTPAEKSTDVLSLSDTEKKYLDKIFNLFLNAANNVLSTLVGSELTITLSEISKLTIADVKSKFEEKNVKLISNFNEGFNGDFEVIVDGKFGAVLAEIMNGEDGSNPPAELTELHESAICEAINQMIGSGLTDISGELGGKTVATEVPQVKSFVLSEDYNEGLFSKENLVIVNYKFSLLEEKEKSVCFLLSDELVKSIVDAFEIKEQPAAAPAPASVSATESNASQSVETSISSNNNLMLLLDVPLMVRVNLGAHKMLMKNILNLGIGSIIELDKYSSEPVDVTINKKIIAHGEVVVVDENFGVRILEQVSPLQRLELAKKVRV